VLSYFVGNCNEVSATNLLASLATVLAIVGSVALEHRTRSWSIVVRLGVGTLLVVGVAIDLLANRWVNGAALAAGSYDVPLASRRSFVDERIVAALQEAGARDGDRVMLHLQVDPGKGAAWAPWLPFTSLVSLMPIPEPRQEEYCTRYLARRPAAKGWLVETRDGPDAAHLRAFLERTYRPTRVVERDPFWVTVYERRAK
jgi:hypothetical protein